LLRERVRPVIPLYSIPFTRQGAVYLRWEQGWITGLKYEDEMKLMMLQRTNSPNPKSLNSRIAMVSYRKYRGVAERVAGVPSGVNAIAVLRAGGPISRGKASSGPAGGGGGVKNEDFVRLVRAVRLNKQVRSILAKAPRPSCCSESPAPWTLSMHLSHLCGR
jgi:hypothetical protein